MEKRWRWSAGQGKRIFLIMRAPWICFFKQLWLDARKHLKKADLQVIQRSAGLEADTLNIQWIHRAGKYYHMAPADIYEFPDSHPLQAFPTSQVKQLVEAESAKDFMDVLQGAPFTEGICRRRAQPSWRASAAG